MRKVISLALALTITTSVGIATASSANAVNSGNASCAALWAQYARYYDLPPLGLMNKYVDKGFASWIAQNKVGYDYCCL